MRVYIETTESPNIIKLKSDDVLVHGSYEFSREDSNTESPIANTLLQFPFINKVYFTANFIALEKVPQIDWEDVIDELKNIVNNYLEENNSLIPQKKREPFSLYAEMTPNPEVMKFVSNKILTNGMLEVKDKDETTQVPLASFLFQFSSVKEVFIHQNYVSVTKNKDFDWSELANELRVQILEYLQSGKAISHIENYPEKQSENNNRAFSEIEHKIKDILEEYVNPAVAGDGGNIELVEYETETKTVRMLLQGACSGCPSSTITLKNGIETMLKQFLPNEVESVEAING
ncbi:MAG: NifU family protein [Flavobacteriales bacterium]|nr:NifU family protein [Flavobacteriales bacterium]